MSRPAPESLPSKKAVIWETGDYLPALTAKLRELEWEIQAIVRASSAELAIDDIPVLHISDAKSVVAPDAIVIPGNAAPETAQAFLDFLSEFRTRYQLPNKLVHPAAFAEFHSYNRPRFLVTGLPGSGNMIAQTLYLEIMKRRQAPDFSFLDQGLIGLASAYYWTLHHLLRSGLDKLGAEYWHVTPWETGYGAAVTGPVKGTQTWQISGLTLRCHLWSVDMTFSHEAPTDQSIAYFERNGFKIISLVRHPLDVIVSNAAKICRDSGLDDPGLLLSHPDWYRSMVDAVASHFEAIVDHQARLQVFRYEDLLANPVEYLERVQYVLDVAVEPSKLQSLWSQFGLKPLPTALGRHFWKPREGKWRTYMNPMQKDAVSNSRLPELAKTFGYTFDQMDGNHNASTTWENLATSEIRSLAYWDCAYSYFLPKARAILHPDVQILAAQSHIVAYGFDLENLTLSSFFRDLAASPIFQGLVSAAHVEDLPMPPRWSA